METALNHDSFDRFVLLQGLEYPIKSNKEINAFFEANVDKEFICAQNISVRTDGRSVHKYRLYHFYDKPHSFIGRISRKINSRLLKRNKIPRLKPNTIKDSFGNKMQIYQGCAQFALTRAAVEYIVDFSKKNKKFNKYFKTVFTSDEIYFHTILFNSEFYHKTSGLLEPDYPRLIDFRNLTYFEYPGDTIEIVVFKKKTDYERLAKSGYLYVRKVNSESVELLDYIDECHLSK